MLSDLARKALTPTGPVPKVRNGVPLLPRRPGQRNHDDEAGQRAQGRGVSRVALLDVNVLMALSDPDHTHHEIAHDWFADHHAHGWATCAVTQNGFVANSRESAARAR